MKRFKFKPRTDVLWPGVKQTVQAANLDMATETAQHTSVRGRLTILAEECLTFVRQADYDIGCEADVKPFLDRRSDPSIVLMRLSPDNGRLTLLIQSGETEVIVRRIRTRQKGSEQGMSPLKPVSRTTLVEQVAHQVLQMISEGRWKAGEKLPSESEFCRGFHVGRSTVREALRSLAYAGVLRKRSGDGTYVAEGPSSILGQVFAPGLLKTEKDIHDLFEARRVLEAGAAALCAERATEEELQNLERLAKELQRYPSDPAGRDQELDVAFHLAMAAASKNQILAHLLGAIRHLLLEGVAKSRQLPGSFQLACDQHLEIVQALKERNPRKARRAIQRHLWSFQQAYDILVHASKAERAARDREVRRAQESRA